MKGYRSRSGVVYVYTSSAEKKAAYQKATEGADDLRLFCEGWDEGPPEFVALDGRRCFVGADGRRFYFKTEARRRVSRLQVWSSQILPRRFVPRLTDHLFLVDQHSGEVAHIYRERPGAFIAAVRYLQHVES